MILLQKSNIKNLLVSKRYYMTIVLTRRRSKHYGKSPQKRLYASSIIAGMIRLGIYDII